MSRTVFVLTVSAVVLAGAAAAGPAGFGLGVIVGEPTGLSAKAWLGGNVAVDAAAAWSFFGNSALHLHADVLYHNFSLINVSAGELPLYYGVGGRIKFVETKTDNGDKFKLGVRVPVGLEYLFPAAPVGIFLELVPLLDVIPGTDFGFNAAVGARFYFR